jgi:predicted helicase
VSEAVLRNYLANVQKAYQAGNATEHTHRPTLKALVETIFPGITATNEPKRVACGAPDFIITNKQTPLGYIETKDIEVSLDKTERTDQMKRYLGSLANLILTDYLEFRWYVAGQHRATARLARVGAKGKLVPEPDGLENVGKLLQAFIVTQAPTVASPRELATRMAANAQLIRHAIRQAFESEDGGGSLHTQMQSFREVLLPDLTYEQFADMYAQTICYGLFAARCNAPAEETHFTREHAAYDIPKTNPFLRKMFGHIAGPDLDERIVWAVDDLAELLNRADMTSILQDFGKRTRQEDPVVHFYETFLAEYDPKMRELRGVYYTPEPVVSYIVSSVDHRLKNDFGLAEGLADASRIRAQSSDGKHSLESHRVQILDPATGTGTFLYYVIRQIYEMFKSNKGMWSSYVSQHLLPRLFGFELLMAPYAVAHMKLGLQLKQTGYDVGSNERLGVYLTNTLEEGFEGPTLPFAQWLAEEAEAAGNVKYDFPVMVVFGNPPYSGHSANSSWRETKEGKKVLTFIGKLVQDYYKVDGASLGERNPKWLQDDYVKFIRFAQWRIERTGYGILAFITNHGYLDNPTFRGMRQNLMQSFDEIYVLDLHGNSKKKERSPDGTKDENVFDIQQGVAIGIFVKRQAKADAFPMATVRHADLWGPREVYEKIGQGQRLVGGKYHWLAENDITTTQWKTINPEKPFYLFVPQDVNLRAGYEQGWKITEAMPVNVLGFQTHRDYFAIDFDKDNLQKRFSDMRDARISDQEYADHYSLADSTSWQLAKARRVIRTDTIWQTRIIRCLYRPFDWRFCYFAEVAMDRPRPELRQHMLQPNISLNVTRQTKADRWGHALVANTPTPAIYVEIKDGSNAFPLYLYPEPSQKGLFDTNEPSNAFGARRPNLAPAFITDISNKLTMTFVPDGKGDLQHTFGPEDIFNYMYAVFHSPTYRERYAEFLKIDFPRLPLTSNADLFRELCKLGDGLVGLHLMETSGQITTSYPETGNNVVEKVEYTQSADEPERGRVWINKTQYFAGVPPQVWNFHVGGYQVCQKWLKDRKWRALSYDDIRHYQKIVAALAETIYLMDEIDETIEMGGGWPIE